MKSTWAYDGLVRISASTTWLVQIRRSFNRRGLTYQQCHPLLVIAALRLGVSFLKGSFLVPFLLVVPSLLEEEGNYYHGATMMKVDDTIWHVI